MDMQCTQRACTQGAVQWACLSALQGLPLLRNVAPVVPEGISLAGVPCRHAGNWGEGSRDVFLSHDFDQQIDIPTACRPKARTFNLRGHLRNQCAVGTPLCMRGPTTSHKSCVEVSMRSCRTVH